MATICFFSTKTYDRAGFEAANDAATEAGGGHDLVFFESRLDPATAELAAGADAVCAFVNDDASGPVLEVLHGLGVRCLALRCAGYNNVDLEAATRLGLPIVHVPAYSPNAVAEHTIALILALNRRIHRAYNRVRDGNFALDGLVGFDLAGKTAGVVGTGRIGMIVARLLWHLRCNVLAVDPYRNEHLLKLGVEYVDMDRLYAESDIITLNTPLTSGTHHMINDAAVAQMRPGVMLVNTGRGALVDTQAVVAGLKSGQIGSLALDVYEEEAELFFEDRSEEIIDDDVFARLLTFPNVLITAHQAFLTREALAAIAETTLANVESVVAGGPVINEVRHP
jgi:D-lactate dehydrogenase